MNRLTSKISLNIKGKNINRFIKKLRTNKIDLLKINYKNKNEADIIIKKADYPKLKKIKSIYDVTEVEVFGMLKIKKKIYKSKHLIIALLLCFILFISLTNMIFQIEVIHSNKDIRKLLKEELKQNGIKEYSFKKNYREIQKIKEKIINKYPDKIEWLEIEENGTKYTVRVEERKIPKTEDESAPRNIIAKKPGVIKKVIAHKGEIVKDMDDYVEKGELIISGDLIFNNEIKGKVRSEGKVYAEIWYLTKTEYPFVIDKKEEIGKEENTYALKILNKTFKLKNKNWKVKKENTIISHRLLPIKLVRQKVKKTKITNQILTFDEALEAAKQASTREVKSKLDKDEYIIRNTYLKSSVNNSTIEVEMFFSVYEDITDYAEIG